MKKIVVIYFSKFGNTQQVAQVIADTLTVRGDVRLLSAEQLEEKDLKNADLVVMGAPTHNMNLPKKVRPILASLPRRVLKGKAVAAFDTSYKMSWWLNLFTAGKRLASKMRKLGGKNLLPPEIFLVTGREGPLFEGELNRARDWANRINQQYVRKFPSRVLQLE